MATDAKKIRMLSRGVIAPAVAAIMLLIGGCGAISITPGSAGSAAATSGGATTGPVAPGHLRATSMDGAVTGVLPAHCRQRTASDGQPLPDPTCTPGVINDQVNQSDLNQTICHSGYSSSVRASESATESYKRKIMVSYGEPGSMSGYELDHLVSLELGGSNDAGNLWPQRNDHPRPGVLNSKDLVENALHHAVCGGQVSLAAAQVAIATDWTTALSKLGLPPVS